MGQSSRELVLIFDDDTFKVNSISHPDTYGRQSYLLKIANSLYESTIVMQAILYLKMHRDKQRFYIDKDSNNNDYSIAEITCNPSLVSFTGGQ